jgi:mRNA interferase RelE/StbE
MNYELLRLPRAIRQLRHLRKTHHPRVGDIIDAIGALASDPRPPQSEKLTNRPERRIRVGDYRLLYLVDDLNRTVTITAIAHRREVYR